MAELGLEYLMPEKTCIVNSLINHSAIMKIGGRGSRLWAESNFPIETFLFFFFRKMKGIIPCSFNFFTKCIVFSKTSPKLLEIRHGICVEDGGFKSCQVRGKIFYCLSVQFI